MDQAVARDATSAAKSAIWPEAASLDQAPGASPDQAGEAVVVSQHLFPERSRLANGYKDFFFQEHHLYERNYKLFFVASLSLARCRANLALFSIIEKLLLRKLFSGQNN